MDELPTYFQEPFLCPQHWILLTSSPLALLFFSSDSALSPVKYVPVEGHTGYSMELIDSVSGPSGTKGTEWEDAP